MDPPNDEVLETQDSDEVIDSPEPLHRVDVSTPLQDEPEMEDDSSDLEEELQLGRREESPSARSTLLEDASQLLVEVAAVCALRYTRFADWRSIFRLEADLEINLQSSTWDSAVERMRSLAGRG